MSTPAASSTATGTLQELIECLNCFEEVPRKDITECGGDACAICLRCTRENCDRDNSISCPGCNHIYDPSYIYKLMPEEWVRKVYIPLQKELLFSEVVSDRDARTKEVGRYKRYKEVADEKKEVMAKLQELKKEATLGHDSNQFYARFADKINSNKPIKYNGKKWTYNQLRAWYWDKYLNPINNLKNRIQDLTTKLRDMKKALELGRNVDESTHGFCYDPECNGTIDAYGKCGVCEALTCTECKEKDHPGIECDPDVLASLRMARQGAKTCPNPKCGHSIQRAYGCNHMFCTYCDTYFDWETLRIFKRPVGNPEAARKARENLEKYGAGTNYVPANTTQDVPEVPTEGNACDGPFPNGSLAYWFTRVSPEQAYYFYLICERVSEIPGIIAKMNFQDMQAKGWENRVKLTLKEIDKSTFLRGYWTKYRNYLRDQNSINTLEVMFQTMRDALYIFAERAEWRRDASIDKIIHDVHDEEVNNFLDMMECMRDDFNKLLVEEAKNFGGNGNNVPCLSSDWWRWSKAGKEKGYDTEYEDMTMEHLRHMRSYFISLPSVHDLKGERPKTKKEYLEFFHANFPRYDYVEKCIDTLSDGNILHPFRKMLRYNPLDRKNGIIFRNNNIVVLTKNRDLSGNLSTPEELEEFAEKINKEAYDRSWVSDNTVCIINEEDFDREFVWGKLSSKWRYAFIRHSTDDGTSNMVNLWYEYDDRGTIPPYCYTSQYRINTPGADLRWITDNQRLQILEQMKAEKGNGKTYIKTDFYRDIELDQGQYSSEEAVEIFRKGVLSKENPLENILGTTSMFTMKCNISWWANHS